MPLVRDLRGITAVSALAALLATACGAPSVVIRPDDTTFNMASARYRRTLASLDTLAPRPPPASEPAADEALFAQAEALYWYRFGVPATTDLGYAEQAAADMIEISPLEVLAASEGVGDLRLDAYNGAAQLYESLLARFPDTPLRPLALYRLGWALRNVSIDGLPRSSKQAFAEVAADAASPLAPLATDALRIPYKTQGAAVAWSLIPGAGQMYAGEWLNGSIRLGITVGFAALTIVPPLVLLEERHRSVTGYVVGVGLAYIGVTGIEVSYTAAYEDAERAALEFNERQEAEFDAAHPEAP